MLYVYFKRESLPSAHECVDPGTARLYASRFREDFWLRLALHELVETLSYSPMMMMMTMMMLMMTMMLMSVVIYI